ncbi:MAG: Sec-independent protein translocase protein TatB [Salinarimonas sp.]
MFDLSWGEMMLVGAVALIVIGPKDLPRTLRAVGQVVGKVRRMAGEFQGQFNQAMREAELDSVRKEVEGIGRAAKAGMNPAKAARDEIKRAVEGKPAETKPGAGPSLAKGPDAKPDEGKASVVQSADGRVSFAKAQDAAGTQDAGAAENAAPPAASAGDDPGARAAPAAPVAAPQPIPVATPASAEKEEVKP